MLSILELSGYKLRGRILPSTDASQLIYSVGTMNMEADTSACSGRSTEGPPKTWSGSRTGKSSIGIWKLCLSMVICALCLAMYMQILSVCDFKNNMNP